jgi:hypothetical protein
MERWQRLPREGIVDVMSGFSKPQADPARHVRRAKHASLSIVLGTLVCALATAADEPRVDPSADGYALKALYLHHFATYVDWPDEAFPSPDSPLLIGLLGEGPFHGHLREISYTRLIDGRRIVVRRFESSGDVRPCHILFVAKKVTPADERHALEVLANHHVLIVGESEGFAERGGAVNFFIESGKLRFEVNLDEVREHRLKVSSKVLRVAKIVDGDG